MKKIIISLFALALFAPGVLAATIVSEYQTTIDQNNTQEIAPVLITSTSDGDITAEHGIRILLVPYEKVLWDDADLVITGKAKDTGKVNLNVKPEYAEDYKSVFIPVMKDFEAGDWLSIQGLSMRGYDESFNDQLLGLDTNGDKVANVSDINVYYVGRTVRTDITAPYSVRNVEYSRNADGSITLNWEHAADYDFDGTTIDRVRTKGGFTQQAMVYNDFGKSYTDNNLADVTAVTYSLISRDYAGNHGEPVVISIDLTEPVAEEPEEEAVEEEVVEEEEEEVVAPESEVQEMSRLLNYYNVRYSIKCMPSGVAVPENNSACLWARIDLVYAQELSGQEKVPGLALSARELELMALRRQWPEMRYQDNCVEASEPAAYCPALGKALNRISYFLD